MMLDPLTEVGIGMFVTIVVSRSQLVMDILCHCERRESQQEQYEAGSDRTAQ